MRALRTAIVRKGRSNVTSRAFLNFPTRDVCPLKVQFTREHVRTFLLSDHHYHE